MQAAGAALLQAGWVSGLGYVQLAVLPPSQPTHPHQPLGSLPINNHTQMQFQVETGV